MAKESVTTKWLSNMAFETEVSGHRIVIDADPGVGGENRGPRPKPFMLAALGGCTAMDVISILGKMRVEVDSFNVIVEGDLTEEYPKHFYKMHVIYEFTGKNLPLDKLQKAVSLSEEKYCGVSAVYKKALELTSEIKIIES
ncbi:MAG: osmotically inducible protein C [Bacteroidetes bacterium GWE2_41_25]|nr:MAG: osmotically inducible protein C [Bacteroidetes bacterium GWA2_40_15]OFX99347.1 MAG: osmotically inducible protein C [Bacteroidetes bacterium GWC2_40_22]OFY06789.1 MAG: osmotically inducible protein C [Bacteroidetes bacterium GWE2_41_25]OFY59858.1 MAG: osmotically inducible protein C [Bacteroidetes bacterium GWF2_41_9]HAM08719.1 osmotically inducible protein C [Bacteroidales bacterium]